MEGTKSVSWMLSLSIWNSRFGILCFIGVVNNFAANLVAKFGEIASNNLAVIKIIFGIFNVCTCISLFFDISINFNASYFNLSFFYTLGIIK